MTDQAIVLSLAGAVALTLMQMLVWAASLAGVADVAFLQGVFAAIATAAEHVSEWSESLGLVLLFILTLATALLWHLNARQASRRRIEAALEREIERILEERQADPKAWGDVPPNEAMEQIDAILSSLHEQWQAVRRDPELDEQRRLKELGTIEAQATRLIQLRQGIDVRRRVRNLDALDQPATWRERLMVALASRGFISDARTAASYLGLLATMLTLLTTVGFASGPVASVALGTVNALELKAHRQRAEQALTQAAPADKPEDSNQWTDADERALQHLSASIVRAAFESRSFPIPIVGQAASAHSQPASAAAADEWAEPADAWEHSRRDQVRRGILESTDATPASTVTETAPDSVERTVQATTDSARHDATVARVAKETETRLRSEIRSRPTLLRAFRAHAAEYQQVIHPADLRSGLVSALFGHITGQVDLPPALEHVIVPMAEDTGETVLHEYLRVQELRALESLARGQPVSDALNHIRYQSEVPLRHSRRAARDATAVFAAHADEVHSWLDQVQPTGKPAGQPPSADAIKTATTIAQSTQEQPRESVEALATYDDYFPARPRGEETTSLGTIEHQILQAHAPTVPPAIPDTPSSSGTGSVGGGGGGGGGGGRRLSTTGESTRISYARSRSFRMARGFARVGGVLIGRPPDHRSGQPLNVNAIAWTLDGSNITLRIGARTLGPFPASTVDRALRYAADGRVTTVTMTSAAPLLELKILLNPVLEDSPIGGAAIELDRLVDTYARMVPSVRAEEARIRGQYVLYTAAWTLRQISVLAIVSSRQEDTGALLTSTRARLARLLPSVESALRQPRADLLNAKRSILAAKPEWFDIRLVRLIDSAAATGNVDTWLQQLTTAFTESAKGALSDREHGQDTLKSWFDTPAQFEVWSGVREQPWHADDALDFAAARTSDELWPFQFMLQASFVSEPKFATGTVDNSPFEYSLVSADIQTAVARGIHSAEGTASNHPRIVQQMREFAVLQRVFRLALAGQMGRDFPLERLTDLAAAVRPYRTVERTMRWNVRPGAIESAVIRLLDEMPRVPPQRTDLAALATKLQACRNTASPRVSQASWEQNCGFTSEWKQVRDECKSTHDNCEIAEVLKTIESLTLARRLRTELGVQEDEAFIAQRREQARETAR